MLAEFETYIRANASLTDAEIAEVCATAVKTTLRKKDMLLRPGEVCRYKTFICKGLLRTYCTREDGSEHIIQFSQACNWTTDAESYENLTPSRYYIEALEDSEILMWEKKDFAELLVRIPELKAFTERLIFQNLNLTRKRVVTAISATGEEKYDEFIANYPDVFARVPLHMVASYLGVSLKTLSRIRHAQVKR